MQGQAIYDLEISIHAPARGATVQRKIRFYITRRFNPRTREGCDKYNGKRQAWEERVSIHAPARGATKKA